MTVEEQGRTRGRRNLSRAFALQAAALCAVFFVAHLLGFKQHTSVLSGTAVFGYAQQLGGVIYIVSYFLFVACVPVLLIAAALAKTMDTWHRRRKPAHVSI